MSVNIDVMINVCVLTKIQLFLGAIQMDGNAKMSIDLEDNNYMDG